jgi:hypothetical protein
MREPQERVAAFLQRAEACRADAERAKNQDVQVIYRDLADQWETLAKQVETLAKQVERLQAYRRPD